MKKGFKIFTGILTASMLFVQPVLASDLTINPTARSLWEMATNSSTEISEPFESGIQSNTFVSETFTATNEIPTSNVNLDATSILLESSERTLEQGTYQMSGEMDMVQNVSINGEAISSENVSTSIEAIFEAPSKIYMKTLMDMFGQSVASEFFYDGETMYARDSIANEWLNIGELDLSEFMSQNTNILTKEQIELLGDTIKKIEDNVIIDGKSHYAISVEIDKDDFTKMMSSIMDSMSSEIEAMLGATASDFELTAEEEQLMRKIVDDVLDSMTVEMYYDYIIDKETLLPVKMTYEMNMDMDINILGEALNTNSITNGYFDFFGYGEEITFPVVK